MKTKVSLCILSFSMSLGEGRFLTNSFRGNLWWGCFPAGSVVKNPPVTAEDARDTGLIPELGRSPGGGNGNPELYSCLENPMDRGSWRVQSMGLQRV